MDTNDGTQLSPTRQRDLAEVSPPDLGLDGILALQRELRETRKALEQELKHHAGTVEAQMMAEEDLAIAKRQMSAMRVDWENYTDAREQLDHLAIFLRNNYQREIATGQHAHMPGIAASITHYLGIERRRLRVRLADLVWRLSHRELSGRSK